MDVRLRLGDVAEEPVEPLGLVEEGAYREVAKRRSLSEAIVLKMLKRDMIVLEGRTLKGSIASDDGFDLKFDVPNAGQDLFQLCDQFTKPCVEGQTYTLEFTKLGSGSAPYSFRHQVHAQAANMQIQPFSSGTVNLAAGGVFEATYPPG